MIGFGTSGIELAANYDVTILGPQHLHACSDPKAER